jgi:hypothetical protein
MDIKSRPRTKDTMPDIFSALLSLFLDLSTAMIPYTVKIMATLYLLQ